MYIYIYTYTHGNTILSSYLHSPSVYIIQLYYIYIMMAWVMANPPFLCNIYIYIQIHDRLQPLWFHVSVEAPRCFPHVPRKQPIAMWPVM